MSARIVIVFAALLSLAACGPDGFVIGDDTETSDDGPELEPIDAWAEGTDDTTGDATEDSGDEGGEAGGEGGELLPDMGTESEDGEDTGELVDACCVCDPNEPWCEIVGDGPDGCIALHYAIGMPTEWHTGCEIVDGEVQCADACNG